MKMTEWFPADVKPIHVGVYETISPIFGDKGWFSLWDGEMWRTAYWKNPACAGGALRATGQQFRLWRGLAEKPE